jgi:arsenate reductase (thioredoxin)
VRYERIIAAFRKGTASMKLLILACVALIACKNEPARPAAEVVFICEHGAAKSVVASEYFNRLAAERGLAVRAIARGADPQADLSVSAVKGLKGDGLPPTLDTPRPLTAGDLRRSARVVAFDCEQPAMKALKGMDACWDDVPAVSDDYARARDAIRAHVAELVEKMIAQSKS